MFPWKYHNPKTLSSKKSELNKKSFSHGYTGALWWHVMTPVSTFFQESILVRRWYFLGLFKSPLFSKTTIIFTRDALYSGRVPDHRSEYRGSTQYPKVLLHRMQTFDYSYEPSSACASPPWSLTFNIANLVKSLNCYLHTPVLAKAKMCKLFYFSFRILKNFRPLAI